MTVIILGAFGGRLDQEIANIHALFKWQKSFHRIVLLGKSKNLLFQHLYEAAQVRIREMEEQTERVLVMGRV